MKEGCRRVVAGKMGEGKLVILWEDCEWSNSQGIGRGIWEMNREGCK